MRNIPDSSSREQETTINSQRFLKAFSDIEHLLRKSTHETNVTTFAGLIIKASTKIDQVKWYLDDLREFADLRNAIVHERSDGHTIAEPHMAVVNKIEFIADKIISPPLIEKIANNKVNILQLDSTLDEAVKLIYSRSFSQFPIFENGTCVALLTSDTVSRWLGAKVGTDVFSLKETKLREVLEYTEDVDNFILLKRAENIFTILFKFQEYQEKGKRLNAIIISQNGFKKDPVLGIFTIWDLPKIYELLRN